MSSAGITLSVWSPCPYSIKHEQDGGISLALSAKLKHCPHDLKQLSHVQKRREGKRKPKKITVLLMQNRSKEPSPGPLLSCHCGPTRRGSRRLVRVGARGVGRKRRSEPNLFLFFSGKSSGLGRLVASQLTVRLSH